MTDAIVTGSKLEPSFRGLATSVRPRISIDDRDENLNTQACAIDERSGVLSDQYVCATKRKNSGQTIAAI